jgi:tetratricopeptide (TPR) repeat protein
MLEAAQQAFLAKDYKKAITLYSTLIAREPDNPVNHLGLAKALFKSKQYAEAKIHAQKALDLDASLAEAYALLAYIQFWMKGDFKIVYSLAEQAYAIDENSIFCIRSFAFASSLVEKQEQSAHLLERLLDLEPDEYDVYVPLIGIYISMNKREDAYRMSWQYLKSQPSLTSLYCFYVTAMGARKGWATLYVVVQFICVIIGFKYPIILILPILGILLNIAMHFKSLLLKKNAWATINIILSVLTLTALILLWLNI